jgi:hypothetical protein
MIFIILKVKLKNVSHKDKKVFNRFSVLISIDRVLNKLIA